MLISINGSDFEMSEDISVRGLLEMKKIPENSVIIELNGEILKRENWERRKIKSRDRLELIRIIGGG